MSWLAGAGRAGMRIREIIRQGIEAGDPVVTDGHLRLVPGSRVSVRDAGAEKAGS